MQVGRNACFLQCQEQLQTVFARDAIIDGVYQKHWWCVFGDGQIGFQLSLHVYEICWIDEHYEVGTT